MAAPDFSAFDPRPGEAFHRRVVRPRPKWLQIAYFAAVACGVGFGLLWIPTGVAFIIGYDGMPVRSAGGVGLVIAGLAGVAVAIVLGVVQSRWNRAHSVEAVATVPRLARFAADNELEYTPLTTDIPFRHEFFRTALKNPRVQWMLRSRGGRETVIGTFVVDIPQRHGRVFPIEKGFVAIRLDRSLPHIMLVPRSEFAPLVDGRQVLSLEGDFDRYFTLYCPPGAERDALAVITPDVMASMIDDAALWTAEIVDDWLLLSHPSSFGVFGTDDYRRLFELVDRAGGEFVEQTDWPGRPPVTVRDISEVPQNAPAGLATRSVAGRNVAVFLAWVVVLFGVPAVVAFGGS